MGVILGRRDHLKKEIPGNGEGVELKESILAGEEGNRQVMQSLVNIGFI